MKVEDSMRFQTRKMKGTGSVSPPKKRHAKMRKTRKGRSASPVHKGCPPGLDNEACLEHTIKANGFVHLQSPDDGNCFFYSLETYFKLMETPRADKDHMDLRSELVAYLLANAEKFRPFIVKEYKVKSEAQRLRLLDAYITKQIKEIAKPNVYDTELGDIVPQEATNAFGVRIVIHNWRWSTLDFFNFDLIPDNGVYDHTIHLLRKNENHFDLLFPKRLFDDDREEKWEMVKLMRNVD